MAFETPSLPLRMWPARFKVCGAAGEADRRPEIGIEAPAAVPAVKGSGVDTLAEGAPLVEPRAASRRVLRAGGGEGPRLEIGPRASRYRTRCGGDVPEARRDRGRTQVRAGAASGWRSAARVVEAR